MISNGKIAFRSVWNFFVYWTLFKIQFCVKNCNPKFLHRIPGAERSRWIGNWNNKSRLQYKWVVSHLWEMAVCVSRFIKNKFFVYWTLFKIQFCSEDFNPESQHRFPDAKRLRCPGIWNSKGRFAVVSQFWEMAACVSRFTKINFSFIELYLKFNYIPEIPIRKIDFASLAETEHVVVELWSNKSRMLSIFGMGWGLGRPVPIPGTRTYCILIGIFMNLVQADRILTWKRRGNWRLFILAPVSYTRPFSSRSSLFSFVTIASC